MLRNNKGQVSPQAFEDIFPAVMVLISAIIVVMLIFGTVHNRTTEDQIYDMQRAGNRLLDTLTEGVFKADKAGDMGGNIIEEGILDSKNQSLLTDEAGYIEYSFSADITSGSIRWEFGKPIENAKPPLFVFSKPVTIIGQSDSLREGTLTITIWK